MQQVTVYGADWCPMTRRALDLLELRGVPFKYIDLESDPAACEWVKSVNEGKERKPTIDIDGRILVEPSDQQLESALA